MRDGFLASETFAYAVGSSLGLQSDCVSSSNEIWMEFFRNILRNYSVYSAWLPRRDPVKSESCRFLVPANVATGKAERAITRFGWQTRKTVHSLVHGSL